MTGHGTASQGPVRQGRSRPGMAVESTEFDGLIVVAAGPFAYQDARIVADRLYGPNVELNQIGWADGFVEYEVVDE